MGQGANWPEHQSPQVIAPFVRPPRPPPSWIDANGFVQPFWCLFVILKKGINAAVENSIRVVWMSDLFVYLGPVKLYLCHFIGMDFRSCDLLDLLNKSLYYMYKWRY